MEPIVRVQAGIPNLTQLWICTYDCSLFYRVFSLLTALWVTALWGDDSMTFPLSNREDIAIRTLLTYAEVIGLFQCFQCFLKFFTSCTIKPVLGVTIKAIFKLSVCILQNCEGIGVRVNSPPQHLTTPLSDIACNSSLLYRSSAWINTHEHRSSPPEIVQVSCPPQC